VEPSGWHAAQLGRPETGNQVSVEIAVEVGGVDRAGTHRSREEGARGLSQAGGVC
jgi:hypothetical protein